MIFRLTQKLNVKIKAGNLATLPLEENPFADWSAHLFIANRTQYILLSNTKSLYSTVMHAKGITDGSRFIDRALNSLREFMEVDGEALVYDQFIAPTGGTVRFAKALDRTVTGSMNDLVYHAKISLTEAEHSPLDVGFALNGIPFSSLKYATPRVAFKAMGDKGSEAQMKRQIPRTPAQWLKEIKLAIADARAAELFGSLVGTDANLFHLAPLVCLKFRGQKLKGKEAERVIEVALANYVVNSDPSGNDHDLAKRPMMAFTLCYVAAHLALDLLDEEKAGAILSYCEERLLEG